jgi:hypothetical protein
VNTYGEDNNCVKLLELNGAVSSEEKTRQKSKLKKLLTLTRKTKTTKSFFSINKIIEEFNKNNYIIKPCPQNKKPLLK